MVSQAKLLPGPGSVPFAEGKDLVVDIPVDPKGISDVYIGNTTSLCVDIEGSDNVERLLAINVASRHAHKNEPIPRVEMAEKKKVLT